jgi:hypothetical protein
MVSSHILERLARVVPPSLGGTSPARNPWYAVACNSVTAAQPLANTVFQKAGLDVFGNATPGLPGNYGRAILRVQAETNDLWLLFGNTSSVQANSAIVGVNASMHIPVNQERDFECDPQCDLWLSAVTSNGAGLIGTCRYGIVSFHVTPSMQSGI